MPAFAAIPDVVKVSSLPKGERRPCEHCLRLIRHRVFLLFPDGSTKIVGKFCAMRMGGDVAVCASRGITSAEYRRDPLRYMSRAEHARRSEGLRRLRCEIMSPILLSVCTHKRWWSFSPAMVDIVTGAIEDMDCGTVPSERVCEILVRGVASRRWPENTPGFHQYAAYLQSLFDLADRFLDVPYDVDDD